MARPDPDPLTQRQREVAQLVADGCSTKEAAYRLGLSPRTVEVHRGHARTKLGARNTADLIRIMLSRDR